MKMMKIIISICGLFLLVCLNGCLQSDAINQPFRTYQPMDIGDGLLLSDPVSEGVDANVLEDIYRDVHDEEQAWQYRSLLVFRNGRLIAESYMKDDADRTTQHLIWSCTKQFMGVLTGMAIQHGLIESIDDPISKYLPDYIQSYPDKAGISIRNLLMMQSGIDYSNDGVEGQTDKVLREIPDNITEFILERPVYEIPGSDFNYNDGDPQLMSAIIQAQAKMPTDEWADQVLLSLIDLKNYTWTRYRDGISLGGFGIETTPREMAKFALCVADSGRYNDQQLIDPAWLEQMTSEQVILDEDYSFGYYWWIRRDSKIYHTWGHGGQFAFIIPSKNMIVVITAIPNTQGDHQINADEAMMIVDRILQISE